MNQFIFLIVSVVFLLPGLARLSFAEESTRSELKVVPSVDLNRYLGAWYSIASIPQVFDRKCVGGTTATYTLNEDGTVAVRNACYLSDGSLTQAKGVAWVADPKTNAKLKVTFIPFLRLNFLAGDYWIIDLGPDYEYAVVGHPSRKYGWILSRTPELPEDVLPGIIPRLEAQGYDFSQFQMVNQKDYPPQR
jgi:apolipoprotein D and lipocalin family protein